MRKSIAALVICWYAASAQETTYKKPPKEIADALHAPVTPVALLSPAHDLMLLTQAMPYPPIADVTQPMLRLAGLRINPRTNGPHMQPYSVGMALKKIADGSEIKLNLPPSPRIWSVEWSADGNHFSFLHAGRTEIELWVGDRAGRMRRLASGINAVEGDAVRWMPDNRTLLVHLVASGRGAPPATPSVPEGPDVQESAGKHAGTGTFEDLLQNVHDEKLYEYYAASQLALIPIAGGRPAPIGKPAIFEVTLPSPDGKNLLVSQIHRPFSYLYRYTSFPKEVDVWDLAGKPLYHLTSIPLADSLPLDGVATGPRHYAWKPTDPATLVWVETLDGGNGRKKVPYRDRVVTLAAPYSGAPVEIAKLEHRYSRLQWMETGAGVVSEYNRARRWTRSFLIEGGHMRDLFSRSTGDRYKDPGAFVHRTGPGGYEIVVVNRNAAYLIGEGAGPEGDRPFLNRMDLATLKGERLFRSDGASYELPLGLFNADTGEILTRRETPADPPNYFVRQGASLRALTSIPDPAPSLRRIQKQLVTYKRADGVQCSFTLYLPPDYQPGTRLPTVLWAYPREYNDPETAGQVAGSAQRFTSIRGYSHLFFLLRGYAVLDGATMPVVGDARTANNTYIEQIVMSAKAAVDKATEMGVTDPDRVGVGGHSYGAFMTANLLAHSDIFRAGIARSGAYNRTLTPFGFQSERRTLWDASDIYLKMSPFLYANRIKEPILMIHGQADNNMGTFPIQSERMYQAIRGNGGTVRLVMLPGESHAYAAKESVEHVLYEMMSWFDRYVKDAGPRKRVAAAAAR